MVNPADWWMYHANAQHSGTVVDSFINPDDFRNFVKLPPIALGGGQEVLERSSSEWVFLICRKLE